MTSILYISQLVEEQLTIELEKGTISNQSKTASSQPTVAAATEEKLSSETASLRVTESATEPPTRMAENFNSYRVGQHFTFYYVYGKIEDVT